MMFLPVITLSRFGMLHHWIELDWIGLDWIGLDWIGLDWIGLDWIRLDWIELNWIGLDCIGANNTQKRNLNQIIILFIRYRTN